MFETSKRETEERSEKVVEVGEAEGEFQKEKESRDQPRDKEASTSGSMVARGATMSFSSAPENSGGEKSADEFILLPLPPQFVPRHFDDLEDALVSPDLSPTYQTGSNSLMNRTNSYSNENQDTNCDSSDYLCGDDHASDAHSNDHALIQEEIMLTGGSHLPNLQIQLEHSYTHAIEKRGIAVEVKEESEEEHNGSEAERQWEDQEVPPAASNLDGGDTISISNDPESNESEGSSDEESFVSSLSPSSAPGQLEDDDSMHARLPPGDQTRSKRESQLPRCVKPKQCASCIFPYGLSHCRLF